MPRVSVIVPTNRIGGIDVVLAGLAWQTERDFELVLVDDLLARRAKQVLEHAKRWNVKVTHVEPQGSVKSPISGTCIPGHYQDALNTGIVRSTGEIIIILCDYTMLQRECVARHAAFHEAKKTDSSAPSWSLVGGLDYVKLPMLHPDLPRRYGWLAMGHDPTSRDEEQRKLTYKPWLDDAERMRLLAEWWTRYEVDLGTDTLDMFMMSTFRLPLDTEGCEVYHHEKADLPAGPIAYQYCNLKNNSFLTEDLLAANGLDEAMDGCHVYQDSELAGRLAATRGMKFIMDHEAKGYMFDPHGIAIIRRMEALEKRNLDIYNSKATTGQWGAPVNPDKSLRGLHRQWMETTSLR